MWTLPDDSPLKGGGGRFFAGNGGSVKVETQRNGVYRAYSYLNPDIAENYPSAHQVAAFDRLLWSEFPGPEGLDVEMISDPFSQTFPRDLTPSNAMARHLLDDRDDPLAGTGLLPLKKRLIPLLDIEVRYWGGFARGINVLLLRRTGGSWSAARIVPGIDKRPRPVLAPKSGWSAFWANSETLGIFTLPDQENAGSKKGYADIMDGYSTLVEYQHNQNYRAYFYNNPTHQTTWPPAKPMAALDAFVTSQFPR